MPHTPGPWKVLDYTSLNPKKGYFAIVTAEDSAAHIADVFPFGARRGGYDRAFEDHATNAKMLASSATMFSLLNRVLSEGTELPSSLVKEIRNTLSKIEP